MDSFFIVVTSFFRTRPDLAGRPMLIYTWPGKKYYMGDREKAKVKRQKAKLKVLIFKGKRQN
jgi:hypothetical protein